MRVRETEPVTAHAEPQSIVTMCITTLRKVQLSLERADGYSEYILRSSCHYAVPTDTVSYFHYEQAVWMGGQTGESGDECNRSPQSMTTS